ncbi:MAG: hypothetical protein HYX68_10220 [Planctomycetes bacterium]|nr:hypothetical protein [Planctomycetota bacterium]
MALRFCYVVLALTLVIASGCRSRSSYQPTYAPAVVATTPAPAPCPQGQIPAPPPPGVLVPR